MNFIDLFAGAGGLSEGFIRAGFRPIVHVEMDRAACFTLRTRSAYHYLKENGKLDMYIDYLKGGLSRKDLYEAIPTSIMDSVINMQIGGDNNSIIHKLIEKKLDSENVDLIIGGPPCQAYSLAGRARSKNGMKGDHRNYLYVHYAKFLEKYNPKLFVFENVLGLKSAGNGVYLDNMRKLFLKKEYETKVFTVEANRFGVLQNRKRIIMLGWRKDAAMSIPNLDTINLSSDYKVRDLLNDLPVLASGEGIDKYASYSAGRINDYLRDSGIRSNINVLTQHVSRPHTEQDKKIYKIAVKKWNDSGERLKYDDLPEELKSHNNRDSFGDRFKVVAGDLNYSQTVVAHIAKDGHYYIHPDIDQNRSLTVREAARLQAFPDDYYFEGEKAAGSRTAAFRQIGNAVPPLMAYGIANALKKHLK